MFDGPDCLSRLFLLLQKIVMFAPDFFMMAFSLLKVSPQQILWLYWYEKAGQMTSMTERWLTITCVGRLDNSHYFLWQQVEESEGVGGIIDIGPEASRLLGMEVKGVTTGFEAAVEGECGTEVEGF
jgi:hypothetical protein